MIELTLDTRDLYRRLRNLGDKAANGTIPLLRLDRGVKAHIGLEWNKGKAKGGTVRGVKWPGFAEQHPGVPAWGGVPKVYGRGNVKGKKRPSGQRVTRQSILMQDTGAFRSSLVASPPQISVDRTTLTIGGGSLVDYGKYQDAMRKVVQWYPAHDQPLFNRIAEDRINEICREFSRGVVR